MPRPLAMHGIPMTRAPRAPERERERADICKCVYTDRMHTHTYNVVSGPDRAPRVRAPMNFRGVTVAFRCTNTQMSGSRCVIFLLFGRSTVAKEFRESARR